MSLFQRCLLECTASSVFFEPTLPCPLYWQFMTIPVLLSFLVRPNKLKQFDWATVSLFICYCSSLNWPLMIILVLLSLLIHPIKLKQFDWATVSLFFFHSPCMIDHQWLSLFWEPHFIVPIWLNTYDYPYFITFVIQPIKLKHYDWVTVTVTLTLR